jgi:hypothetical protein
MRSRPHRMWLRMLRLYVVLAAMLVASPVTAQEPAASSSGGTAKSSTGDAQSGDLPVSLDRIRAGLKRQVTDSLLKRAEIPPDFRIQILEQQKIDDMLSKLDFKGVSGPAPAGGLYGYEQQQRLFNSVDHPLVQPYAAFSGGELITIAIENLIARYLGGRIVNGITEAEHARAERAAREEVDKAIADYCAARPDRADIQLCTSPSVR